ncbi:hypothetical protein BpHYR1_015544 [Brachionus plicatilis]|uniref:Uncharacterized protein n=1 Tax=Brachionus plicatilis TaxID=10195 RepID=A0A3M7QA78_BRAPC|nr:hypothetical protein BpHYR1_015544 [Brachionus plicatilis]
MFYQISVRLFKLISKTCFSFLQISDFHLSSSSSSINAVGDLSLQLVNSFFKNVRISDTLCHFIQSIPISCSPVSKKVVPHPTIAYKLSLYRFMNSSCIPCWAV